MSDHHPLATDPIRLAALDAYDILDTPPEQGFDDVVRIATRLCAVPVALVSLVTHDRQWFKANVGFPHCETDLDRSVCKFVLSEPDLLVIPDLAADPRTAANPLVTGEPGIRFYAGAPLRTPEGHVLGSLCVIDTVPRPAGLTSEQVDDLRALARQVSGLLEMRRAVDRREVLLRARAEAEVARQAVEQELRTNEARQRHLLQQVPSFVGVLAGPDHIYEYVNDAYVRTAGPREYLGRRVRDVFPDLADQGFFELLDQVYATGVAFSARTTPIRFAGEDADRYIDFIFEPIRSDGGTITGIFVAGYDVSEQQRTALALQRLNADLERKVTERALARSRTWQLSPEIMGVLNAQGYFEQSNPAWATVLGWSEPEIARTPFFDFIHPDDIATTQVAWKAAMDQALPALNFENRYRHKDGTWRWFSWVAVPDDGKVYCSARDVTVSKEQAVALSQAEEALRQSQKMEAVGQLTGGLAHDFNNLLAGISGSLELMQTRMSQGRLGDLDRYMTVAQGAAKRAAALTHRLLAFSRRQTLAPKPVNVNVLIGGMEELLRRTIGPAVALEVVGAAGLWSALIDPGQLENALLNLCINARDAMPDGGRITIETANKWLDRPAASARNIPEGQYLSVCVTDTGTGMPRDMIDRVFEPFFTTKPIGQGTGLGLSMIHGFTQQSGGQVRIYSEVGQGTTVCLYLPRHYGQADDEDVTLKLAEVARAGQDETVLIVDDEPSVRMLVTEVLEDLGYTAIEAADSVAGLRILQSEVRIDLLVTDVGLPGGMNGRQMADAGRQRRPDLRVLFITGYAENAVLGNGHLDPGMQVLTKPFAMEALASRIKDLIGSG